MGSFGSKMRLAGCKKDRCSRAAYLRACNARQERFHFLKEHGQPISLVKLINYVTDAELWQRIGPRGPDHSALVMRICSIVINEAASFVIECISSDACNVGGIERGFGGEPVLGIVTTHAMLIPMVLFEVDL
ncbi:predicted protein [Sclerotinia sclerotiorum 1980 UF-70]|uniref:Uncharacterized protein n=1 Tax=Sclerotinia sclerotiorum (strain ATCC 18683 / 1980 / Ss-1) TaxID=665079 RepID=A7ESV5_SCLS1|nr:predicted protein [Sclerotinia sclerotiorum 1980 UF-70]EDN92547.1 predicted protein [Sclerotinia sclerotiorum 1980 UF-70]